jgi:VIT1/CCC1 family predicted Fe2+/Mn2+ transporter
MENRMVNNDIVTKRESLTELLEQLANNSATMVRDEIQLVVQGIREKVAAVRTGVITVTIGAVILFAAFMSLCAALIIGLAHFMAPVIAAIVAVGVLALIGGIIAYIGYKQLKKAVSKT